MSAIFDNIKKTAMIAALEKSLGIVTAACKTVQIDRQTHYNWYAADLDYKNAVDGLQDMVLDFAESKLHQSIQNGSDTATIFYLKTKGKKRGYIERQEIDQTIKTEPIQLIFPDNASLETN